MSRSEHFKDGSQQLDLLADHFVSSVSNSAASGETKREHVDIQSDKTGNLLYLAAGHEKNDPDAFNVHAYRLGKDSPYQVAGQMYAQNTRPEMESSDTPYEVGSVFVTAKARRQGIASRMWKFGRQFRDIRHSDSRTEEGSAWTYAIGGPDLDGDDTSTYRFPANASM